MSRQPGSQTSQRVRIATALIAVVAVMSVAFAGMAGAESSAPIEGLGQEVTTEDLDQEVTTEDLDQDVTTEDLDQDVTTESLDQEVTTLQSGPAVDPTHVGGNPTCGTLGFAGEKKIDPVPNGNSSHPFSALGQSGTIELLNKVGNTFDFTSTLPVAAVFVKAGNGGNLYVYTSTPPLSWPAGPGASLGDTGLVSPQPDSISHISFCFEATENTRTGDITVVKSTDVETGQSFPFDGDLGAFSLVDGASTPFAHLPPGDYTVLEEVPDGWTLDDVDCGDADVTSTDDGVVVHLDAGESVTCTFENSMNTATVVVEKLVDGEPFEGWKFEGAATGGPVVISPEEGLTDEDGELAFDLELVSSAGSQVSITELLPDGYGFEGVECDVAEVDVSDLTATFTVFDGDEVRCTFSNTVLPASIEVVKTPSVTVAEPGDVVSYTYVVTNTGQVTLTNVTAFDDLLGPATLAKTTLDPGEATEGTLEYTVTEADAGTTIVNIVVATGETPLGEIVEDFDDAVVEVTDVSGTVIEAPDGDPDEETEVAGATEVLGSALPFTGSPLAMLLKAALWLIALGGMALAAAGLRRRRMA